MVRLTSLLPAPILLLLAGFPGLAQPSLNSSVWTSTHSPLKKGTELYFQGDTLVILDMDGMQPADQYRFARNNDTLTLWMLEEYSVACREEGPARYRLFWAQNGEKLLLKPIHDLCMPRFTRLVSESPWYRKHGEGETRTDWHFLDPEKDNVAGASIYEAYKFLKNRKPETIRVAVIDSPVDYTHEELATVMWKNEGEKEGNQNDDDKNGFRDDMRGWFFAGSKKGVPVRHEQLAATQTVAMWKSRFESASPAALKGKDLADYQEYRKALAIYTEGAKKAGILRTFFSDSLRLFASMNRFLMQSEEPLTTGQVAGWKTDGSEFETAVLQALPEIIKVGDFRSAQVLVRVVKNQYSLLKSFFEDRWLYDYNLDYKPRETVGDHPEIPFEKMYGAGFLQNPTAGENEHGTHVAGIIGAARGNGKGVEGIAGHVRIMTLGAVPQSGDERDKDVANCIRYAADNGARIINMSFAKKMSAHRQTVEEAIRYAEKKGVLFFHAAGNAGLNRDTADEYPTKTYLDGTQCSTWIEVGNSAPGLGSGLVNPSSSYGKKTVDLFAPGTDIYSTLPGNQYASFSGTSMASPVAAGIAALIWSHFPSLTAAEVKQVLLESVYKPDLKVSVPGSRKEAHFSELSRSGGIVNARNAVFAAEKIAARKKR
jgi:cell wall-associated protease